MKVTAGAMGEKPANNNPDLEVLEVSLSDTCSGAPIGDRGDHSELTDDIDQSEYEEREVLDGEEDQSVFETEDKPVPPPRSDSQGDRHRVRHMVDIVSDGGGDIGMEEEFSWEMQWEYLLTCMGFVNSLECLLRFPTLTIQHGGGVFFVAYVVCMFMFGCPMVYLEMTLGQYAIGGPLAAWKVIPLFKGVGYCMVCITFFISCYYTTEVTWAIYYLGVTLTSAATGERMPWDCTNKTDEHCKVNLYSDAFPISDTRQPMTPGNHTHGSHVDSGRAVHKYTDFTGAFKYFYVSVLDLQEEGHIDLGYPVWYLVLCLILAWVLIFAGLISGPRSIGKVMYIMAPFPYVALISLFVMSCFVGGSIDGIKHFLSPDWYKLASSLQIWRDSAHLVIHSLSLGTGCLHTLAGYTHFHSHCFRNLLIICLSNVLGVLLAGLTMCSGLGILSNITNISLAEFRFTEYELGFALYPYILTKISESLTFHILFFSAIILTGLATLMVYVQSIMGAAIDTLKDAGWSCSRERRWAVQIVLCFVLFLLGLTFSTQGGIYALHFTNHYVGQIAQCVVIATECCILMYILGAQKFVHNIEDMTGNKDSPWWKWNWKFVSPFIQLGLISCSLLLSYKLNYRDVPYPEWSEILGWCLSLSPLVCIPAIGAAVLFKLPGDFKQKFQASLQTPSYWGAGLHNSNEHLSAPDYVICKPDAFKPSHGLAMLTANLYIPNLPPLNAEEIPQESGSEMTGGYMSDLMTITSTDSVDSGTENEGRGNWRGKLEFLLSCLGYVIGLGNIWRFPYLVYRNGGGAFFIPYLVMLVFCGLPLVFMEMAFGQYASLGPVTIWRAVPIFKGIGYAMVISNAIISVYYNVVNAWAFHYLFASFTSILPWSSCNNDWNTEDCSMNKYVVTNCSFVNTTYLQLTETYNTSCGELLDECISNDNKTHFPVDNVTECINWLKDKFGEEVFLPDRHTEMASLKTPSEEYFFNEVLYQSEGLHSLGGVQWLLALYLFLSWFIVFVCLVRGINSAGKVAYFVVLVPILLLVILLICASMVEGHLEGIRFYVTPNWNKLLNPKVWSDAATQVFFSLSTCSGGLTTLSSYNKFHNNIYRDAVLICLIDTLMSILAGFTVFACMGILAHELNTTVENVVSSNVGLVFVTFPASVVHFEPSAMWSAFFFLMILLMGMSSIIVMTEAIVTVIIDEYVGPLRKLRVLVLLVTCCVLFLLGLPLTTRGGMFLIQLLDEFCGGIPMIIIGIFMCTALAWVYKARNFCTDIQHMTGRPVRIWWVGMWSVVTPLIILFILISTVIGGVKLDDAHFPTWAEVLGVFLTVICVISIPLVIGKTLIYSDGSLLERIRKGCRSDANWGPALIKHWNNVDYYPAVNTHNLSVDIEQSPVPAISNHVDLVTSVSRLPSLTQSNLVSSAQSITTKRPQELRQKAILNHAYSNPQCSVSNSSIDQIKPRLSIQDHLVHGPPTDVIFISKKLFSVKCKDMSTQTDARSYTLALKQGSIKAAYKEMKIVDTVQSNDTKGKNSKVTLEVEVTRI